MGKLESKICLDTDFLINFLRKKWAEVNFIKENENNCILATTHINLFELFYGAYKSGRIEDIIAVELLKDRLVTLELNDEAVRVSGEIAARLDKIGKKIDFRDLFIGVICVINGFILKTYNVSDFSKIHGLKIN